MTRYSIERTNVSNVSNDRPYQPNVSTYQRIDVSPPPHRLLLVARLCGDDDGDRFRVIHRKFLSLCWRASAHRFTHRFDAGFRILFDGHDFKLMLVWRAE